jgi:alpha-1,6-mannosyltransferase
MRIVQLANFHGPQSGGIRTALAEWRRGYTESGHEVHLVAPGPKSRLVVESDGQIHSIASPLVPGGGGYRMIVAFGLVRRLLDTIQPDAIEVSDRTTLISLSDWAHRRGVHSSLVIHERLDNQMRAILPSMIPYRPMVDYWNRRTMPRYDAVIATSQYGAMEAVRVGIEPRMVPLGVDTRVFRPLGMAAERSVSRLVFLGRLSRDKRPDLALEALRTLMARGHHVELVFIGDGPLRRSLANAARGLPVSFTGFITDRHHVSSLLAGADVSIVPCPGECFGLAALESLACGTPVVVAANSGAAELIEDGGGIAVPAGPLGFAHAIEKLLSGPSGIRASARMVAEGYSWAQSVEAMIAVHSGVVVPK